MSSSRLRHAIVVLAAASCGSPGAAPAPMTAARSTPAQIASAPAAPSSAAPLAASPARRGPLDAATILARLRAELLGCFTDGLRSTPEMTGGRLSLNASIDAAGKPSCVIPSNGSGITQEVADCMAARVTAARFDGGAAVSVVVPVVIRAGAIELGERPPDVFGFDSIETVGMPNAFDRAEALLPDLEACARGADRSGGLHHILVAARVAADGRTECALATSTGTLPPKVADCAAGVLRAAKFPPPRRGGRPGLLLVPLNLLD